MDPMEIFQTTELAPDVEYFIDAALEHDEIDAGTHFVCKLYGPRTVLTRIVDDKFELSRTTMAARLRCCAALADLADEIIRDLPHARRAAITLAGLRHGRTHVHRTAWFYAIASMEDMIVGGCVEDYKKPGNRQEAERMWHFEPSPKQRRRLYSPQWMRRYVKQMRETAALRRTCSRLLSRCWPIDFVSAAADCDALMAVVDAQRQAYRIENERRIREMITKPIAVPRITIEAKRRERHRRRVIHRAASTAAAVLGTDAVSRFARGEPVIIDGATLSIAVERSGSSAHMGHSAIGVTALDKQGTRLASMCVYHERTPALDQLTALGLSMAAGEEEEIIRTANLSNITDAGRSHPLIAAKIADKITADVLRSGMVTIVDAGTGRVVSRHQRGDRSHHVVQREKQEAYWQETRDVWLEATGIAAMGRAWGELNRALGPLPTNLGYRS